MTLPPPVPPQPSSSGFLLSAASKFSRWCRKSSGRAAEQDTKFPRWVSKDLHWPGKEMWSRVSAWATYFPSRTAFIFPFCWNTSWGNYCHELYKGPYKSSGLAGDSAVKTLPAMQETRVQSLGRGDPLEEGIATHSSILPRESYGQSTWWATVHGVAQSRTQLKWLSSSSSSINHLVKPPYLKVGKLTLPHIFQVIWGTLLANVLLCWLKCVKCSICF